MKILVFSDSHSCPSKLLRALNIHNGKCDLILFLGDGLRDLFAIKEKYPEIPIVSVKGNCDSFFADKEQDEIILDLDGIRAFITHGHKYGVKYGYQMILDKGIEKEVDIIFFGHTHLPCDTVEYRNDKQIRLFNPGSIAKGDTYGVINTAAGVIITNIAKIY